MYWNIDSKLKRKKIIELIISKCKVKFVIWMTICVLLDLFGVFLFVGSIIVFRGPETLEGKIAGPGTGMIFITIFVLISEGIRKKVLREFGSPYSKKEKEFIHLEKAGVEFGYHDIFARFETSMVLYQIYYEDIREINYDPKLMLLTITGKGQLTVYDDFHGNRINYNLSQRRFYSDSKYSFILATVEADKIVNEIKENIREENDYFR